MAARLVAACNKIAPGQVGSGVVLRSNPGDIPTRRAVEFHGAGVQDIGRRSILLAGVVVGVEVILVSAGAAIYAPAGAGVISGDGFLRYFPTIQFLAAHSTIPHFLSGTIKRRLLENLIFSVTVAETFWELAFNHNAATNTRRCFNSFLQTSRLFDNMAACRVDNGVVAAWFTSGSSAYGTGFRRFTGSRFPLMRTGAAFCFTAHATGFRF